MLRDCTAQPVCQLSPSALVSSCQNYAQRRSSASSDEPPRCHPRSDPTATTDFHGLDAPPVVLAPGAAGERVAVAFVPIGKAAACDRPPAAAGEAPAEGRTVCSLPARWRWYLNPLSSAY